MPLKHDKPFPKRPRLKGFDYTGTHAYFITILTHERKEIFISPETVNNVLSILKETILQDFNIAAYCFMPDHLHLLLLSKSPKSDLKRVIKDFNQKSGFMFIRQFKKKLWHISYYDHILRKEEELLETAKYIFNNPVRKGLVNSFKEYPFSGSMMFQIDKL
ncbi:hypothetical protein COY52_02300 [Candidatus Desantisbacteria bacterium CG_4_10_14_0_8_um_filter_48_22]|uniref:Transposase IS200-like domain-containing protein n=1 Tax=Candidatus Desantisbacteria bacterium CG_4_10_14_0_8_um_filter_48_22 TaxID=1974543 RepID=A0A2M7SEB7_9BACT|nr:MAG: hypothetical protein COY52_02300 [Candidatus Desantisbacteria bacterium CG_4_10_14_0_8_um_filter_48_22]